jgi:hypothetical protein
MEPIWTCNLLIYINTRRAVRFWLLRRLQPCNQMVPLISESLDRRLTFAERVKLRLHLLVCAWCARYLKQLKFFRAIFKLKSDHSDPGPAAHLLSSEARARIVAALSRRDESC